MQVLRRTTSAAASEKEADFLCLAVGYRRGMMQIHVQVLRRANSAAAIEKEADF